MLILDIVNWFTPSYSDSIFRMIIIDSMSYHETILRHHEFKKIQKIELGGLLFHTCGNPNPRERVKPEGKVRL